MALLEQTLSVDIVVGSLVFVAISSSFQITWIEHISLKSLHDAAELSEPHLRRPEKIKGRYWAGIEAAFKTNKM